MGYTIDHTPYAVICPHHGRVWLTEDEYLRQLEIPDIKWKCWCGKDAEWDDVNYENMTGENL